MRCSSCNTVYAGTRPTCPKCEFLNPKVVGTEHLPPGQYDTMMGKDGRWYVIGETGKKKH